MLCESKFHLSEKSAKDNVLPWMLLRTAGTLTEVCQADTHLQVQSLYKPISRGGQAPRDTAGFHGSISFNSPGLNVARGPQNNPFPPQLLRPKIHLLPLTLRIQPHSVLFADGGHRPVSLNAI